MASNRWTEKWSPPPFISLDALPLPFVGDSFYLRSPFYSLLFSSRPLSGPTDSVSLRTNDAISCHRDHCDVISRGQAVQGGVWGGIEYHLGFLSYIHSQKRKRLEVGLKPAP
jgi:hypothetical protein